MRIIHKSAFLICVVSLLVIVSVMIFLIVVHNTSTCKVHEYTYKYAEWQAGGVACLINSEEVLLYVGEKIDIQGKLYKITNYPFPGEVYKSDNDVLLFVVDGILRGVYNQNGFVALNKFKYGDDLAIPVCDIIYLNKHVKKIEVYSTDNARGKMITQNCHMIIYTDSCAVYLNSSNIDSKVRGIGVFDTSIIDEINIVNEVKKLGDCKYEIKPNMIHK